MILSHAHRFIDRRHYRDVLTEEEAEMIAVAGAREIRLLGSEF